ncbi:hypothetical protein P4283_28365 [Bacillus thuringiensis]|nr:hypothetical protein [Bacillus thuringiensis]
MKFVQKFAGIILSGTIGLSGLLFLENDMSYAEIKSQDIKDFNTVHVALASHTWYMLSGRSVDIISGDVNEVILDGNIIKFTKPGIYTIRVNGCVYNDLFTFQINK